MSKLISRAAVIVAHYENVRRVAPDERRLGAALEGFLSAIMPELDRGEDGVYVRLEKQSEYGRDLNFFGIETSEGVFITLQGDKDEKGDPWTEESIRKRTIKGDLGLLRNPSAWTNAFFSGTARGRLVWWGSPALWSKCDREGASAARLAWEALAGHGRPWEWEFQLRDVEPWYIGDGHQDNPVSKMSEVRREWCREVRHRALKRFAAIWTPPGDFPLEVLRDRGDARPLQAIAYYLMEHPLGPGLRPEAAARVVGSDRRELTRALEGYFEHNPNAKKWPINKPKPWEITEIRSGDVMAHH